MTQFKWSTCCRTKKADKWNGLASSVKDGGAHISKSNSQTNVLGLGIAQTKEKRSFLNMHDRFCSLFLLTTCRCARALWQQRREAYIHMHPAQNSAGVICFSRKSTTHRIAARCIRGKKGLFIFLCGLYCIKNAKSLDWDEDFCCIRRVSPQKLVTT
jgi:hypothetical protein